MSAATAWSTWTTWPPAWTTIRRLVALIAVNNETGAIQPLRPALQLVRDHAHRRGRHVHFHTDAVQALCRGLEVPLTDTDSAAVSAHKLGGPVGVGALWLRGEVPFEPLSRGGGQEDGRRAGTENVAGITAFARQAAALAPAAARHLRAGRGLCTRNWLPAPSGSGCNWCRSSAV